MHSVGMVHRFIVEPDGSYHQTEKCYDCVGMGESDFTQNQ